MEDLCGEIVKFVDKCWIGINLFKWEGINKFKNLNEWIWLVLFLKTMSHHFIKLLFEKNIAMHSQSKEFFKARNKIEENPLITFKVFCNTHSI